MDKFSVKDQFRDDAALKKYIMISPLLDENLDAAASLALRNELAEKNGVSERTLRRYVNAFQQKGFDGLRPEERTHCPKDFMPDNYSELVKEAIQLRREVPKRSIEKIILILEMEGKAAPGVLKRSTLQRHMFKAGFGSSHMDIYNDARKSSSKRFCKPHRMMLVQGDIKYGPRLPIGKNGALTRTYLSSAIDDHSRMILASKFYNTQEESIVADTFRKVILKYGRFDKCYFDNGSQYIAKQLKYSLAKLSIRVAHAPIRSGKSKGKIEKFHQVVDAFIAEAKAKKIRSLEDLNRYWEICLEEYYQNRAHDGIREYYAGMNVSVPEEGISPLQEFNRDTRPLVFIDPATVGDAFLYHEERKVDKGACINFQGRRYETKPVLIGRTVEISYDPAASEIITVRGPGVEAFQAKPLKIGSYCDPVAPLPNTMQQEKPETSRFLDALEKKHAESVKRCTDAISFGNYRKDV